MILVFIGKLGAGKDAAATALMADNPSWARIAFADRLKAVAYEMNPLVGPDLRLQTVVDDYGYDWAKTNIPEVRALLQRLGVAARNHIGRDVWVHAALDNAQLLGQNTVVTDCRFQNEYDELKRLGAKFIRITRDGTGADQHVSETELDGAPVDYTVDNCGHLEDLAEWVLHAVDILMIGRPCVHCWHLNGEQDIDTCCQCGILA